MQLKNIEELTKEQIDELRSKHGPIFKTTICDTTYLCRLIYKPDWDIVCKLRDDNPNGVSQSEIDEKIVNMALLGPHPTIDSGGWAGAPAGVIPTLAGLIRYKSGFYTPEIGENVIVEDFDEEVEMTRPDDQTVAALKVNARFGLKGIGINKDYFVVRPITRVELKQIMQASDQFDQDRNVVEKAVLWPKGVDWDTKGAGYCDTIAQYVIAISGYSAPSVVEDL